MLWAWPVFALIIAVVLRRPLSQALSRTAQQGEGAHRRQRTNPGGDPCPLKTFVTRPPPALDDPRHSLRAPAHQLTAASASPPPSTQTSRPAGACPSRARSWGHQRSTAVTPVICRCVPAGQHFAAQDHDRCPIFQAGHADSIPVTRSARSRREPARRPILEPANLSHSRHSHRLEQARA
jgi:hypothetical protein